MLNPGTNQQGAKDTVFYRLKINGREISTEIGLISLSVVRTFNKIAFAQVVVSDGDVAEHDFKLSNEASFLPGNDLEILLGYSDASSLEVVFKGIITRHTISAPEKGQSRLAIEARDQAVKLTLARKTHFFANTSDHDIIVQLAQDAGLQAKADTTALKHPEMVQYDATDWDFIVMRAEANGMLVDTDNGTLNIKKPEIAPKPHFQAKFGVNLYEVDAEMDARRQIKKVVSKSWDYTKQEVTQEDGQSTLAEGGNVASTNLAQKLNIEETAVHAGHLNSQQLTAWSNARAQQSRLSKICGRARIKGDAKLKIGQTIALDGIGARFNGMAYITGIMHNYHKGWETEVQFGWGEEWFYRQIQHDRTSAAGLLPDVSGLQIGVVIQEGDANDANFKVKIKLPVVDPKGDGIWARLATFEAGNGRGTYFRPKNGDEVIVGFIANDPRYPIILGSVYSSKNTPGVAAKSTDQKYGYKSEQSQQLIFDDTAKTIKLETGTCSITLDGQSNSIELKVGGNTIKIDSANIEVKASAQVTVKGGTIMLN
jgi:Rhs element Vgr protein